jgi:plastocyanin
MANGKKRSKKQPAPRSNSRRLQWAALAGLLVTAGVLAFFAFGRGGGEAEPRRAVRQTPVVSDESAVTVEVFDNDYGPRHLTVNRGAEVTWEFGGDAAHTVTEDAGLFDSDILEPGDKYVLTFADPGTFEYYCTLHHAMRGTLVVQ